VIYSQGDPGDALFFVGKGKIRLTVVSPRGKEAVIAILGAGDFFGEGCLAGQPRRMSTAAATSECSIVRLEKAATLRVLHDEPAFSDFFLRYVLSRNIRIEADLVDQLFNSSEKRLARLLLLLANFGKEGKPEPVLLKISQETLAEMVGTTRPRVSLFMNKFRRMGHQLQRRNRGSQWVAERCAARLTQNSQDVTLTQNLLPDPYSVSLLAPNGSESTVGGRDRQLLLAP